MKKSTDPFVPPNFKIPEKLEAEKIRLRMLTINDLVKDYWQYLFMPALLFGAVGEKLLR